MQNFSVTTYYKFVDLPDYQNYQKIIKNYCLEKGIKGMVLLAREGINSTVAGTPQAVAAYKAFLCSFPPFQGMFFKDSWAAEMPFYRLKVRLKKEIVTLRQPGIDPAKHAGTYVEPKDWNALIQDPEVVVVDTRNAFEVEIGTFKGAVDPKTTCFTQLPDFVKRNLDPTRHRKVAMFCTGGIRCEKSTAYLLSLGFEEVYHLAGGILKYLEEIPPEESLWQGSCFVFDKRIAVNTGLKVADYGMCYGCRCPINDVDKASPLYEEGVSCHKCYHTRTEAQRARARQRHAQQRLARARGEEHIGVAF